PWGVHDFANYRSRAAARSGRSRSISFNLQVLIHEVGGRLHMFPHRIYCQTV
ncbi:unnamed protein product, partial [Linum tenue]